MDKVRAYFSAEKTESLIFISIGLFAIALSLYFVFSARKPLFYGMAIPLTAIGIIQLIVGLTVYNRSPKDTARVENFISNDKNKIKTDEIPRMNSVMKSFAVIRTIELILIFAGIMMFFQFKSNELLQGAGFGLVLQSGLSLVLDYFAEKRGTEYLQYLKSLI